MRMTKFLILPVFAFTLVATSLAADPSDKQPELLWNSWYTMTIGGKIPFGYYNDKVERKDGKLAFRNHLWKKEEGFINEERVVSFGKDDENVSPLLFNFVATYRDTEISIDGTFEGQKLKVKARKGKEALSPIQTSITSKTFLSTLFQAWLGKHLPKMKTGKRTSFSTIFEDALTSRYAAVAGGVTPEPEDEVARKSSTRKLTVDLAGVKSTWYVLPTGEAIRIEKPDQKLVIQKTTEAEARRFLIERTDS